MKKNKVFALMLVVGLVALMLLGGLLRGMPAPEVVAAFPTPQCCAFGGGDWSMVSYMNATVIATTTKTCSTGQQTAAYVLADVQSIMTMPTVNTTTCTYEFSNDNTNWCTAVHTINSALVTDTIACDEFHLFGRYSRICCTSSNTETITVTQRAKVFN